MNSSNPHSTPRDDAPSSRKMFVGGVSYETTVDDLRRYFEGIRRLEDVRIMRDKSGKQKRFGFVTFHHQTYANLVVQMRHHLVKNCTVECKIAQPPKQSIDVQRGHFPTYADAWGGYNGYCTQLYQQYCWLPQTGNHTLLGYQPNTYLMGTSMPGAPARLFPQATSAQC